MATTNINDNLPLPIDKMPEAWSKDERMNAMFAPFRNRSVNPQDWDSKYKFWDELITNYLSHTKQCSLSISELNNIFKRKGRTPLCLPTVIEELYKNGEIVTEQEFLSSPISWSSWAVNTMVKAPVVWSFSKLKGYFIPNPTNLDCKYIHMKTVRELADLIMSLAAEKETILSVNQITRKCIEKSKNKNINETNIKLALLWLGKLRKNSSNLSRHHDKWDCLLKISASGIDDLTEAEENLFKLKENERHLLEKIEGLEKERNEFLIKAKTSMNSGLKEVAKTYIRKKKELDKRIEKYSAILHNLHTLISNIHDAHSNTEVLGAYKRGSEILKSFEKAGLSEFAVRDTMDDMADVVSEMRDVQNTLSESLKINDSDVELEEELNELLNSSSTVDEISLPSVPDSELPDLEKELKDLNFEEFSPPQQMNLSSVNLENLKKQLKL